MTTDAIWQNIPGAEPLHEIYGFWPTLHDARIRELRVGYESRDMTMVLDYSDTPESAEGREEIETRFTMRWQGVSHSQLRIVENDLYGVDFSQTENGIITTFDPTGFGTGGTIRAAGIEVLEIGPAPDTDDNYALFFEIKPPP